MVGKWTCRCRFKFRKETQEDEVNTNLTLNSETRDCQMGHRFSPTFLLSAQQKVHTGNQILNREVAWQTQNQCERCYLLLSSAQGPDLAGTPICYPPSCSAGVGNKSARKLAFLHNPEKKPTFSTCLLGTVMLFQ